VAQVSESGVGHATALALHRRDRSMLGVVLLLVFGFSYSSDLVAWVLEIIGVDTAMAWGIGLVGIDVVILLVVGLFKRVIGRAEGGESRLWQIWWLSFGVVAALNVTITCLPDDHPLWMDLLVSIAFAATLGVLTAVSLNADPLTLFSAARRAALPADWVRVRAVVPLLVGTCTSYIASTVFDDFFDLDTVRVLDSHTAAEVATLPLVQQLAALNTLCESAVNPELYQHVVGVLPLLLLALGVEFNYFRQTLLDPVQRAVTVATVTVMCTALVLALSTLPFDGAGCGNVPSYWHEYLTFVVSVQGVTIGLATLIWMMVAGTTDAKAKADADA
jgi:hypothetical protein